MTGYIERERATEFIDKCLEHEEKLQSVECETLIAVKKYLESIPAADVRPVVLCRDCVKYKTKYCAIDIWHEDVTIFKARDTDFCSYGEKK